MKTSNTAAFPSFDGLSERALAECLACANAHIPGSDEDWRILRFTYRLYRKAFLAEETSKDGSIFELERYPTYRTPLTELQFIELLSEEAKAELGLARYNHMPSKTP